MPSSSRAYIKALLTIGFAIGRHPHVLTALRRDNAVSKFDTIMLPIRSPYHSPHLLSEEDVNTIVQKAQTWAQVQPKPSILLLPCGTGNFICMKRLQAMLKYAIHDVLIRFMVIEAITSPGIALRASPPKDIVLIPIATGSDRTTRYRLKFALVNVCPSIFPWLHKQSMYPQSS